MQKSWKSDGLTDGGAGTPSICERKEQETSNSGGFVSLGDDMMPPLHRFFSKPGAFALYFACECGSMTSLRAENSTEYVHQTRFYGLRALYATTLTAPVHGQPLDEQMVQIPATGL